jgi:putative SOS response-associated peptidase YedK
MCYRFQQNGQQAGVVGVVDAEQLKVIEDVVGRYFGIEELPHDFKIQSNIALTDLALVITNEAPRQAEMQRFSMVPYGAKEFKKFPPRYGNARGETVDTLPAFRVQLKSKRCLVPVSGFYDWVTLEDGKTKVPYMAYLPGEAMFSLAGIWDRWLDPSTNEEKRSFAIITLDPNDLWAKVHDRMPVIMPVETHEAWLAPGEQDPKALKELLQIFPAEKMAYKEFSRAVGNTRNKDEATLLPVGEPVII